MRDRIGSVSPRDQAGAFPDMVPLLVGLMALSGIALAAVTMAGPGPAPAAGEGWLSRALRALYLASGTGGLMLVRDTAAGVTQGGLLACLMAGLAQ